MARPIDEFALAWDALSGGAGAGGWRSIEVAASGPCVLMAARRFPGNEEALLAGFSSARVPAAEKLPEGRGFEVSRADPHGDGKTWLALTRKQSGSVELFAEMVCDVAGAMDAASVEGEERLLGALLSRVRSWQEFMRKGAQALSPEAELGLVGELLFLGAVLDAGVPVQISLDSWIGPLGGVQDFELGTGAVEVKATLSAQGFPAKIGSLEQLDDSVRKPLFVAGVRLSQRECGRNLSEIAESVKEKLTGDAAALSLFADRLLAAGYPESHADRYQRRFAAEGIRVVEVGEAFPRLTPGNIPGGVRRAIYEIDLDRALGADEGVVGALRKLGAL
jgi:hypothetical protein